jgi:hypothetical protein
METSVSKNIFRLRQAFVRCPVGVIVVMPCNIKNTKLTSRDFRETNILVISVDYSSLFGGHGHGKNDKNKRPVSFSATFFKHSSGDACYVVDVTLVISSGVHQIQGKYTIVNQ